MDHKNSPYDSLTGLYHLDTFKTNMKQYLKEQDSESHLALLYTDIAHFERINNLYGRGLADSLLLELSRVISEIDFGLCLYCRSVADHFVMLVKFEEKKSWIMLCSSFVRNLTGWHWSVFLRQFPD